MIPDRKPRFKVVKRKTRCSAIINGRSKYGLKYLPETYVYAPEGTLGIFTFKTEHQAQEWVCVWNEHPAPAWDYKDLIVIPVIPLSRGRAVNFCSTQLDSEGLDEFYKNPKYNYAETPDNTFAYPGVYVL